MLNGTGMFDVIVYSLLKNQVPQYNPEYYSKSGNILSNRRFSMTQHQEKQQRWIKVSFQLFRSSNLFYFFVRVCVGMHQIKSMRAPEPESLSWDNHEIF